MGVCVRYVDGNRVTATAQIMIVDPHLGFHFLKFDSFRFLASVSFGLVMFLGFFLCACLLCVFCVLFSISNKVIF